MIALLAVAALVFQAAAPASPLSPSTSAQDQANGQAALDGMVQIFTLMGSCERHFTADQVRGVRRALEPAPGAEPTALQSYLDSAYQKGKADRSLSAPLCQELLRTLAEAQARSR